MRAAVKPQWMVDCGRSLRRLFEEMLVDVLANMAWNG